VARTVLAAAIKCKISHTARFNALGDSSKQSVTFMDFYSPPDLRLLPFKLNYHSGCVAACTIVYAFAAVERTHEI
jgi:hypothetical protein